MTNNLKVCPFCGGLPEMLKIMPSDGSYSWEITCRNCKAKITHKYFDAAVMRWNRRFYDENTRAENKK